MDGGSANPVPPIERQQMSVGGCFLETTGIEGRAAPLADRLLKLAGRVLRETGRGALRKWWKANIDGRRKRGLERR